MNEKKLQQLFAAARRAKAPEPTADFATDVLRLARQTPRDRHEPAHGVLEQLNSWFPRVALGAAAVIVVCVALELGYTAAGSTTPDDDGTADSSQTFYSVEDL
jgi:hypothetical protein